MSIRLVTPKEAIDELFEKASKIINDKIWYNLSYLGLQCERRVRDRSGEESWFDQSGNLRSSIGYAVYSYGRKLIGSSFGSVLGGTEGSQKGRQMVDQLAGKYSDTYALVVLAAMEYADYVEAMKSKDVLASIEIWAKNEVEKYIRKAIKEAEEEIQKLEAAL